MEAEEITKLVDGVYKNILEKFNPGARNLITSGKVYLKALHGAAQASRQFNEALAKIAISAQQSGTTDIGAALLSVVNVNKEIQEQQMNILKAFYVDLLVPLETNLEKDTKVVQHEQKKFMQQHKVRMDSYQKAVTTMKKQRKKKSSPENHEKELKSLRLLEDQKKKLDNFCDQSYRNAMTQERRRYGFVLERQCSIAKHWMAYHATGKQVIDGNLENWQEVASSRELIPTSLYSTSFSTSNKRLERVKDADGSGGANAQLKKSRSIDAPYGDMRTLHESNIPYGENTLSRAKSDFNLTMTSGTSHSDHAQWDQRPVVKAIYAYMPSGENQLPFEEGDRIALVGNMANGWQFGENLRTQHFGWFPSAYTNVESLEKKKSHGYDNSKYERSNGTPNYHEQYMSDDQLEDVPNDNDTLYRSRNMRAEESSPTRMFGDTINLRNQKKYRLTNGDNPRPGPPPTLPAPVPTNQARVLNSSHSFCVPNGLQSALDRRMNTFKNGPQIPQVPHSSVNHNSQPSNKQSAAPKTSLHSSNDSGFANEPPPQPEVDYSDEEQNNRVPIRRRTETNSRSPREVTSWTLNRNFRSSVDSQIDNKSLNRLNRQSGQMRYDLIASDDEILQASSSGIKRTKSFWKFGGGRQEDILAGMSLWQHRDLVAAPNLEDMRDQDSQQHSNSQMERTNDREIDHEERESKESTLTKSPNSSSSNEKRRKESVTSNEMYDNDENIYGINPVKRHDTNLNGNNQRNLKTNNHTPNFTPKSRMKIMKTIEIDIENPTDVESLSTLKRGQKQYQKEYRDLNIVTTESARNGHDQIKSKSRNSNHDQKKYINSKHNYQQQQQQQQQQQMKNDHPGNQGNRPKSMQDLNNMNSTEDEQESDDNGTLKMSDVNNFFDDLAHDHNGNAGLIMKTVKRKDILKQYYTSEDETDEGEIKSTSSDPYDCIVINDHLVRKDEKMRRHLNAANSYQQEHQLEFQTFRASTSTPKENVQTGTTKRTERRNGTPSNKDTDNERYNNTSTLTRKANGNVNLNSGLNTPTATILPRTRLMKSSTLERNQQQQKSQPSSQPPRSRREQQPERERERERDRERERERDRDRENNNNNNNNNTHNNTHNSNNNNANGPNSMNGLEREKNFGHKTYGPWYDFWDQQDIISQKTTNNSKFASQFANVKLRHTTTNDRSAPMIFRSINNKLQPFN